MSSYIILGTNDLHKADEFYKNIFQEAGLKEQFHYSHIIMYNLDGFHFGVVIPHNGSPANYGNGTMLAVGLSSPEMVENVLKRALENGAKMDGKLSKSLDDNGNVKFYGQYIRDLDNNRLCLTYNSFEDMG